MYPRLLFNADVTDLNRKRVGPDELLYKPLNCLYLLHQAAMEVMRLIFLLVSASCVTVFLFLQSMKADQISQYGKQ